MYILLLLYTFTKMCAKVRCFSILRLLAKIIFPELFRLFSIGRQVVGMETCVFPSMSKLEGIT